MSYPNAKGAGLIVGLFNFGNRLHKQNNYLLFLPNRLLDFVRVLQISIFSLRNSSQKVNYCYIYTS